MERGEERKGKEKEKKMCPCRSFLLPSPSRPHERGRLGVGKKKRKEGGEEATAYYSLSRSWGKKGERGRKGEEEGGRESTKRVLFFSPTFLGQEREGNQKRRKRGKRKKKRKKGKRDELIALIAKFLKFQCALASRTGKKKKKRGERKKKKKEKKRRRKTKGRNGRARFIFMRSLQ